MIITDSAKPLLENLLKEDGKNSLTINILGYGCHSQLYIDTIDADEGEMCNGINVVMREEVSMALANSTIDTNPAGQLVFRTASSCHNGGCGNCGDDEDCQGCGGGCGNCGDCDDDDEEGCCGSGCGGCHNR